MALVRKTAKDYNTVTAIAIDKDKNSQAAVKWAAENILNKCPRCILIHVRTQSLHPQDMQSASKEGRPPTEAEMQRFFLPFRGYCARKGIQAQELVLHDIDVPSALVYYVTSNNINNLVVGASSRAALIRKFRSPDVPTSLLKLAPECCNIYVIAKGKAQTVWSPSPSQPSSPTSRQYSRREHPQTPPTPDTMSCEDMSSDGFSRVTWESNGSERIQFDKISSPFRTYGHDKFKPDSRNASPPFSMASSRNASPPFSMASSSSGSMLNASPEFSMASSSSGSFLNASLPLSMASNLSGTLSNFTSISGDIDFSGPLGFHSYGTPSEISENSMSSASSSSSSNLSGSEAQMIRLQLELKQSIEKYNSASREAVLAQQRVKQLQHMKIDDVNKLNEAKHAEEVALHMVEKERLQAKAAVQAAEIAQRLAEIDIDKKKYSQGWSKEVGGQNKREMETANFKSLQCRRYTIEEIEAATAHFSSAYKIGEGGYGPVFKASLDHTSVAIKVLRPDISQGLKQFQQEVDVLSHIRHPHMVLLLGACPEYGCLVYEHMEYGSLEDRLFRKGNTPPIPWSARFKIAAEIATGLLFLHQAKPDPMVHRDLKPANILLNRNYVSKISDVGLARLLPSSTDGNTTQYHMTAAAGTFCFIDPEYQQTGILSVKSDLYSFGILLLQLITAKPAMGLQHHVHKSLQKGTFVEMLDPAVTGWPVEIATSLAKVALGCSELRKKDRPDLATVVLPELTRLRDLAFDYEAIKTDNSLAQSSSKDGLSNYSNKEMETRRHLIREGGFR